jgi:ssDNA-binding Zn-finger/Zn-ribbon topoisomerase 1
VNSEIRVNCTDCGAPLVERTNSFNSSTFLGCSTWPRCHHTQAVPAYVAVVRAGGQPLPGFEVSPDDR